MKVTKEEFYEWMNGDEDGILWGLNERESRWRLLAFRVLKECLKFIGEDYK